MISTDLKRVQIQDIVENQLPAFAREDFPLIVEFLKQYYISQEYPGASVDLIQNIDQYLKLETLTSNASSTKLFTDISYTDTTIEVEFDIPNNVLGTYQFPEKYGLIQIDDEIILYTGKTSNSFTGCVRGFSGVTSYRNLDSTDKLTFSESEIAEHIKGTEIVNLSALLLEEFLTKIKYQFSPGFQDREIDADVNQRLFVSRAKDFYKAKGTDDSFKILFGALYGEEVEVIKPKDFLFKPSDAQYRVTKDLVVEAISGDPSTLRNQTLFQDAYDSYDIPKSYASITDIEKLTYNDKTFYKLSVDFDYSKDITFDGSVLADFSVHPKTRVITQVSSGSSIIDVDSTIGFPESGELVTTYSSGTTGTLRYTSKSINQFFGVGVANTTVVGVDSEISSETDLRLNAYAYGYVGVGTANRVDMRIGSVLSEPVIDSNTYYYSANDTARIKSLGITTSSPKTNSWIYNISNNFEVAEVSVSDSSVPSYNIRTYAPSGFRIGDSISITDSTLITNGATVVDVSDEYNFVISGQGALNGSSFTIQRNLLKPTVDSTLSDYSYIEKYFANVQNTYVKFNQDLLVASASFPNYYNQPLKFYDKKIDLSGEYSGDTFTVSSVNDHGYQTGDSVWYDKYTTQDPEYGFDITSGFNIEEGVYYVRRLNSTQFKLASSQANLYNENYISVSGIVTSNTLQYKDFRNKEIEHQNLLREIKTPDNTSGVYETEPGKTGILINGVEILNYKSENVVYYGALENIVVSSKGSGYDVINPPVFNISDDVGTGATAVCAVKGSLQRIDILNPGFDYVSKPIVTITGGNGTGAKAKVNTTFIEHSVSFNSTLESARVSLTDNTIGFSTYHKFRNTEKVIYKTDGQTAVSGLTTDSEYYVETVDASTIKLYNNIGDVVSGLNTVSLTSFGVGVHRIQSFDNKQIISNIVVEDSGSGYENKERSVSFSGINTALNQVQIPNHGYNSGEIVNYTTNGTVISGIVTNTSYYVTVVDENNFKLSSVGVGTTAKSFYYDTKQYINLTSTGSGTHTFNYEPISVNVVGEIGVSTFSGQDFNAVIQPIFRGEIESVQLTDGGVGYGASTIIGYNRQPIFTASSGSGAELLPIINNGRIIEVLVTNQGSGYNSPPDLVVYGEGKYAKLIPVITDGKITDVRIESPGTGYGEKTTTVEIIASGSGARFNVEIQQWTVNLFEKYLNIVSDDDGVLTSSLNEDFGIQYAHLYAPRNLRESVYGKSQDNQVKYGVFDLQKVSGNEVDSIYHSPIIGWAYDGNPIYGPYGYSNNSGGVVKTLKSGYEKVEKPNRPGQFGLGFFVEDYEFTDNGDLDEHNGRFCITPDYPNGTYAYFATINPDGIDSAGPFAKYKSPVFPYLIGNTYKSKPNSFNFKETSNQVSYDLNSSEWFRNTTPYLLNDNSVNYNFLYQPNKVRTQTVNIKSVSKGLIDNIGIITGGTGYQVNDLIKFESDSTTSTQAAKAKVSKVGGKQVTNISVASSTVSNLEIVPYNSTGSYVAFAPSPHNFNNLDLVSLSGFNTSINSLQRSFAIGVSTERFSLNTGVGTAGVTGIITYFDVAGPLRNELLAVRENDILQIEDEKVKVLNIDIRNSRIRVLRSVDGTVSAAHTATTVLNEVSRKFTIDSLPENKVTFNYNRELYFNPSEALGVGTISGVGIGTTISFSNPGAGLTQIFIPTRSIYISNHQLNTGDLVSYNNNDGQSIEVATDPTGVTTFRVANDTPLYIAKISNDLIGISTFKVGVGSTGTFVGIASTTATSGLLYLTGIGTGVNHSFTTVKSSVVTCEANKNVVTVATASTHGLSLRDNVDISVSSGITTVVTVQYDDYNRRIIFNPKSFVSGDVDISENTITISDHGFSNGDKVIHTSTSPSGGLEDEKIYYVRRYTKDKIKLCNTRYQSLRFNPEVVDITSASSGTISAINPQINAYKGSTVKFDLSDSSLSSLSGSTLYSAFDMNLYTDRDFRNLFESSGKTRTFEVTKTGTVGVTTNAAFTLTVTDNVPEKLYYNFDVVNADFVSVNKRQIVIDNEVYSNNQIDIVNSLYSGSFSVAGIGTTTTFTYNLLEVPERGSYSSANSNTTYVTNSTSAYGSIEDIQITYKGLNYENVTGISTIVGVSTNSVRSGAILEPSSTSIGKVLSTEIEGIGFDYPTDNTLRPVLNLPEILQVEPLTSFREIGITSAGNNYSLAPNLVVIDGFTGKQVTGVDLKYKLGDTKVSILKNTFGIYNTTPTIIPTSNTNGISINSISYDDSTKEVTVGLNTSFSDSAPLSVGDKVLIENVSVGVGTTGYGYNSSNYGYSLFTLSKVYIPLGGSVGIVTYSLDGYLPEGEYPGNFNALDSSGRIVAEKDFPIFDVKLRKNNFLLGEEVKSNGNVGKVESWNNQIEILKVSTTSDFNVGDLVIGQTSKTQGAIKQKIDFNSEVKLNSSSIVNKGWNRETGFLNFNTERLPDNNYYQNFSYSLKSKVPFETWNDAVSSLNHTSGFLKFSDLVVESQDEVFQGVYSEYAGSTVDITTDISRVIDLNCYSYFDLVTENSISGGSGTISDEIYFSTRVLTDYFESFGNRVLTIDDISTLFNDNPRPTRFSVVKKFDLNQRVKKIFTFASDKLYTSERQALFVTILHNKSQAYIGQYGRVETVLDLGGYDFTIVGTEGYLLFYPTKYSVNNYNVTLTSFDIDSSVAGIGSTALGDTANIVSSEVTSISSPTDIVSIASTYRTSKILLEIDADNGILEYDELNVIHDGTNVEILEYGQLTTDSTTAFASSGLGTYSASISGGNVNITFNPNAGIACTVNALTVSIASTTSAGVGATIHIGTDDESDVSHIESKTTYISASGSPGITTISSYSSEHSAAYYIVSIEDTTNNRYEMAELISVVNGGSDVYLTEYGNVNTAVGLGTIGAGINGGGEVNLHYTPLAGIDVQVRVFQMSLHLIDTDEDKAGELDLNNASITAGYGFYEGTEIDVRRAFYLRHRGREIFLRNFDGSDSSVVDVTEDTILLPEHFFVTGEELVYSYGDDETSIGITTTSVYAIKVNDQKIKLAASAADALNATPVAIDITSVGVGTFHTLTAKNQNTKCLVALDNYIQSPIVATSVTTGLTTSAPRTSVILGFSGITSFFGGDLVQVNDEIMKINTVGYGGSATDVLVDRGWMGTGIATHAQNSLVTKVEGNYNIVDNTINFITAPKGPIPISSTTNAPDERDWTGITTFTTFQGRVFTRSGIENSSTESYATNYVFDDISSEFDATEKTFTLKSDGSNVAGISTNNAVVLINGIFQGPTGQLAVEQDYSLSEASGITSITFTGTATSASYDPNNASIPVGGVIISVGSTGGFGYQPLVSAGGTAVVSVAGTISSVSIGNSGSGYRSGSQTVNVGVTTQNTGTPSIEYIGTAAISGGHIVSVAITNPGVGYTSSNPPIVIFDAPLSYSNIPLIYSNDSATGVGTEATVNIVVGQGSSVIDFEIQNSGYRYGQNQILTVPIGGATGIPTDTTKTFEEFQITIEKTESDKFTGWHFGELLVLDKIENQFNGTKKSFTLQTNSSPITIRAAKGSSIDVQSTLLVFLNDILQVPGEGYTFTGGSTLVFTEAPKGPTADGSFSGDKCKILFYKGSGDVDVVFRDVLETVKIGDTLQIDGEDVRLVDEIISSDTVGTNAYNGAGIDGNPDNQRSVTWCKQTSDKIINGQTVSKARVLNAALVNPTTNLIQSVGVGSTVAYVESVRTFFDSEKENNTVLNTQRIVITSQDSIVGASATAVVSVAGTITSVVISDGGVGYTTAPTVTIANPVGYGTTARATATATLTGDAVSSITVSTPGTAYTTTNPPVVLIEIPQTIYENNTSDSYTGDFGIIVGVTSTSVGVASTGFVLDLFIPIDSYLRDTSIVSTATTVSGIQTGDYFVVKDSNVGSGVTSLYQDNTVLGITTQFLDCVYEVAAVSTATTSVAGVGVTYVRRVTVSVSDLGDISGIGATEFYGEYSWGMVDLGTRTSPQSFNAYTLNGSAGVSTSAKLTRVQPLKLSDYS